METARFCDEEDHVPYIVLFFLSLALEPAVRFAGWATTPENRCLLLRIGEHWLASGPPFYQRRRHGQGGAHGWMRSRRRRPSGLPLRERVFPPMGIQWEWRWRAPGRRFSASTSTCHSIQEREEGRRGQKHRRRPEASSAARSIAGGTRSTMAGVSILYTEILASTGYHRTCFQSRSAI
jgi:hypothetical protein